MEFEKVRKTSFRLDYFHSIFFPNKHFSLMLALFFVFYLCDSVALCVLLHAIFIRVVSFELSFLPDFFKKIETFFLLNFAFFPHRLDQILGKQGSKAKDVYASKTSLASRVVTIERQVSHNKL